MRAWVAALGFVAALTSPVLAGSEEDALQVVEKWAAAFNASDVDAIVARYTATLERWVRRYPEQYFWHHRRWKRQPPGTPPELREP